MSPHLDILAIGEALVEFNQGAARSTRFTLGYGGDTSNCVIAAARLGAKTGYATRVGNDSFGAQLLALWLQEHVDTTGVVVEAGADTGLYFVNHDAKGHHFEYRRQHSAASRLVPGDIPDALLARTRWLHVSGISQAISESARDTVTRAVLRAGQLGVQVSYDLNFRPRLWSAAAALAAATQMLAHCDVFFPSVDEVQLLTGLHRTDEVLAWAHGLGAKTVVLKLGAEGCLVSAQGLQTQVPGVRVQPVDATGAGDCFAGAFLSRLCLGQDALQAARFANAAAALSTCKLGAVGSYPRLQEVLDVLGPARDFAL